jgi:predicted regulator of Ras-like GTPase activity (Roadblock/LC7/MglB family)
MNAQIPPPDPDFLASEQENRRWLTRLKWLFCQLFISSDTPLDKPVDLHQASFEELTQLTYKLIDEPAMIQVSLLKEFLQNFVTRTSEVQGAVLVSPDGLSLASVLPGNLDEERTAAMSAAMLSLGERIGQELTRGVVERIYVEGEKGYSILVGCGNDAVLLILASKAAKQGLLFLEIKRLAAEITPLLDG